MIAENARLAWIGALALAGLGATYLYPTHTPSESDIHAFLPKLMSAVSRTHARGANGEMFPLESTSIARVQWARCVSDPASTPYGRNIGARSFLCHYRVATTDNSHADVVLRADRLPPQAPLEVPPPGTLTDPSLYRVGIFTLMPIGQTESANLLATMAPHGP